MKEKKTSANIAVDKIIEQLNKIPKEVVTEVKVDIAKISKQLSKELNSKIPVNQRW